MTTPNTRSSSDNVNISPYFASSPSLRRSRRKTAAAASFVTALATGAAVSMLPNMASGFAVSSRSSTPQRRDSSNISAGKRKVASVTPSPSDAKVAKKNSLNLSAAENITNTTSSITDEATATPVSHAVGDASMTISSITATTATSKAKKKKKTSKEVGLTNSFEPLWSNRFTDDPVPVHTLILGTHPSIASLSQYQYYGHTMNAFWWICGDCLGFRRAAAISPSTGKPYKFATDLRYGESDIIPYEQQIETIASKGFAMWDVIASCERPGSLDQDIRNETPNDIRGFCQQHSNSLRRIVLANGGTGSALFVKHFRDWLESGELEVLKGHDASEKAFGKVIQRGRDKRRKNSETSESPDDSKKPKKITIISALPVSPAAARYSYAEKRDFWEEFVYIPGLRDYDNYRPSRN